MRQQSPHNKTFAKKNGDRNLTEAPSSPITNRESHTKASCCVRRTLHNAPSPRALRVGGSQGDRYPRSRCGLPSTFNDHAADLGECAFLFRTFMSGAGRPLSLSASCL